MSLKVQVLNTAAQQPTVNSDGSYNLFSAETIAIPVGTSVSIGLGLMLSVPVGYYMQINSGPLAISHNIETSTYCTAHNPSYVFSNGEAKASPLSITLRNLGKTTHTIHPGDIVGRLVAVKNRAFPIKLMEDINKFDDENRKIVVEAPKVKALPKSTRVWLQRIYRDDPEGVTSKYLSPAMVKSILEFRDSEEYDVASNKLTVEASFVWKNMDKETKIKVTEDFLKLQKKLYSKVTEPENLDDVPSKTPIMKHAASKPSAKKAAKKRVDTPDNSDDEVLEPEYPKPSETREDNVAEDEADEDDE